MNDVRIEVRILGQTGEPEAGLRYSIGQQQAEELHAGLPPPPRFEDPFGNAQWQQRHDRSKALAAVIAADLAHKIVQACNPEWRREQLKASSR